MNLLNRFRLIKEKTSKGKYNWLFLPGGPGLGSEYLKPLLESVVLPGTMWRLDFPGDGSNKLSDNSDYDKEWANGLTDVIQQFKNVILVTHSFSSMFVLTIPQLEPYLQALVIMNGAPSKRWLTGVKERAKKLKLPDVSEEQLAYERNKNNVTFRELTLASWRYFMSEETKHEAMNLLQSLPYQYKTYEWAQKYFHPHFEAKWVPKIPTLILGSELDVLTPLSLFYNDQRYQKKNISMVEIKRVSHFPWMEQPVLVAEELRKFAEFLNPTE